MPTITKTLVGGSSDGFVLVSAGGFDSTNINGTGLVASENEATPGVLIAEFRQGLTTNKYADWGVPTGASVTHIKLLGASSTAIGGATVTTNAQLLTDEVDFGSFDLSVGITASSSLAITKTADDYVRVRVIASADIGVDIENPYAALSISVSEIQLEVTYISNVNFTGSIASSVSYAGIFAIDKRLNGSISSSLEYIGSLIVNRLLSGNIASTVSYAGYLANIESINFTGAVSSSVSYVGAMGVTQNIDGNISQSIAYAGFLTNNDPNNVQMSGAISSSVSYLGTLSIAQEFAGNVDSQISYNGALVVETILTGNITSSVIYVGALTVNRTLGGAISSSIAYTGALIARTAYEPVGQLKSVLLGQGLSKSTLITNDIKKVMGNTYFIKKGDTAQTIRTRLEDENGKVNLTACTAQIQFKTKGASIVTLEKTATIESDQVSSTGEIYYTFVTGDFTSLVVGEYQVEWKITFPNATSRNFPTSRIPQRNYNYLTVYENF